MLNLPKPTHQLYKFATETGYLNISNGGKNEDPIETRKSTAK